MRLVELTADHASFRPVRFNPEGLSLIVGTKTPGAKKTYNGVGKSLCLELVHFCLGSRKNAEFERKIPDWTFSLVFSVRGAEHRVSRSTSHQNVFVFDGEELTASKLNKRLRDLVFEIPGQPVNSLTFRALFPQFARRAKDAYVSADTLSRSDSDYQKQLRASYFLGLDVSLCDRKRALKKDLDRFRARQSALQSDETLVEYFHGADGDPNILLQDLDEKIRRLQSDVDSFKVAADYTQVKREADEIRLQLQTTRRNVVQLERALASIEASLVVRTDIAPADVRQLYAEAKVAFPDQVARGLEEVAAFHHALLEGRRRRLSAEQVRLTRALETAKEQLEALSVRLDAHLQYLGSHGALGELTDMMAHLSRLRREASRLREVDGLEKEFTKKVRQTKAKLLAESEAADEHLESMGPQLAVHMERFRRLSRRFYPRKPGGISVTNNDGENQLRFSVNIHIEDDASDGIGEVKIFCYDSTVLQATDVHEVRFLFHDSRLFANIDPRQRAELFRIAMDMNTQYIATVNQEQLEGMKEYLSPEEYAALEAATVLRLTDVDESGKLLGVQVDMHYDRS